MVSNKQTNKKTTEKFQEKILKSSEAVIYSCSTGYLFWELQKRPSKNVSAPETCGVTKYWPHEAVSLSKIFKNFKKATP